MSACSAEGLPHRHLEHPILSLNARILRLQAHAVSVRTTSGTKALLYIKQADAQRFDSALALPISVWRLPSICAAPRGRRTTVATPAAGAAQLRWYSSVALVFPEQAPERVPLRFRQAV